MSAALVLMITDGQDTQERAEDLHQAAYASVWPGFVGQIVTDRKRTVPIWRGSGERRPAPAAAADPVPDRGRDHPGARSNRLIGRSCWPRAAGSALTDVEPAGKGTFDAQARGAGSGSGGTM